MINVCPGPIASAKKTGNYTIASWGVSHAHEMNSWYENYSGISCEKKNHGIIVQVNSKKSRLKDCSMQYIFR